MVDHETSINLAAELKAMVVRMLRDRRHVARVGMNQLVYFVEGDPTRFRSPDLYVIENIPQEGPECASWKTWEGDVPSFALEVVSGNWRKDYDEVPADYDAMGVKELVVFDPWATSRSRRRVRWQVFRRTRRGFGKPLTSSDDRIESRVLGCFLRVVTPGRRRAIAGRDRSARSSNGCARGRGDSRSAVSAPKCLSHAPAMAVAWRIFHSTKGLPHSWL